MKILFRPLILSLVFFLALTHGSSTVNAQETTPSFTDIPADHPLFQVVESLKNAGIINGYDDGTFRPDQKVNRAEAVKIIAAPLASADVLNTLTTVPYNDVPAGAWYVPYVEFARAGLNIIDSPPAKPSFHGGNTVLKAEFIKMLLLAHGADPNSYSEISLPLSTDVINVSEWYYPYLRFAITSSMIMVGEDGTLSPGAELTRGDTSLLLFRLLMYKENRRTQALLSEVESEIVLVLSALDIDNIDQAEYAAVRGLLAARGAHASRPEASMTKGAVKVAEAYHALVRGYRAGLNSDFDGAIDLAGQAYRLGDEAKSISPDLAQIVENVQKNAGAMADNARVLKSQSTPEAGGVG